MVEHRFNVGDRVTWVTRIDGILRQHFGIVDKITGYIYRIHVTRLRPIDEAGRPAGSDTVYEPPIYRSRREKGLSLYTEDDLRKSNFE